MIGGAPRPEVTAGEAAEALAAGTFVLDVRERHEWDEAHAPGATLVPLSELNDRLDEVPTDRPVLVVCHSGMRSARATDALRGIGVDARNVVGGMLAWRDADGPVVSGGDAARPSAD
ncbi:rhodanese-like domain-containing protein [Frigoribacterium sp. PhB24]|uniref:rhodanese-like domain-containing protein n=1 Tax=Frigoribacterium sp. PhB24 TaxID=2485204 RepID=UPI000F4A63DE|nr:rhodanese-like domain-containing protein [Frigoribacterium sp. PhB24]ROS54414.1 rhodanese-related sulfurtransferase [Frigoribacterium sp. PhB24]